VSPPYPRVITTNEPDLEGWYIGLSIVLGFGVILVPTVLGHFGKNTSRGNSNNSFWYVLAIRD